MQYLDCLTQRNMKPTVLLLLCLFTSTLGFYKLKLSKGKPNAGANNRMSSLSAIISASTGLVNHHNLGYYTTVNIGTGFQSVKVQIDTGSSDLLVPSISCQIKMNGVVMQSCENGYNESLSTSVKRLQMKPFSIGFAKGTYKGHVVQDRVQVAGLTVVNQILGVADVMEDESVAAGILGLARPSLAEWKDPVFITLLKQNKIQESKFSLYLKEGNKSGDTDGGELIIGGSDPTLFEGPLEYYDVIGDSYWEFRIDRVTFGAATLCDTNCSLALDCGATYGSVPTQSYERIKQLVNGQMLELSGQNFMWFECCDNIPDIVIEAGKLTFRITPQEYTSYFFGTSSFQLNKYGDGNSFYVLGDVLLRKYYTEFDMDNLQVGIAKAIN